MGFGMDGHEWGRIADFTDYESAKAFLKGGRDKTSRPVAWHTRLNLHENGDIALKYHATDVVTYHPDGSISLDSGGWKTQTTKRRINDYTDMRVFPDKGVWYVGKKGDIWHWEPGEHDFVFQDNMRVMPDWSVKYQFEPPDAKEIEKLRKSIARYARKFADNLVGIGLPDAGDCWFCYMNFDGEETTNHSHLIDHIEEDYFVPSLLFRALRDSNIGNYWGYSIQCVMEGDDKHYDKWMKDVVRRAVRKYIQKRLGLSVG